MTTKSDRVLLKPIATSRHALIKSGHAVLVPAIALFIAARLWHLSSFDLAGDELSALEAVHRDWSGLLDVILADTVHPPLFYLLLKVWTGIDGESVLWLRLFPVLTSIVTLVPFYLLCAELNLRVSQTAVAVLLAAVNGYLVYYAQELRMYSLLLLLTVCSLWCFARFIKSVSRMRAAALFLVNLLLVYTHNFGWLLVGVEWVFLLFSLHRQLYWFSFLVLGLLACIGPWLYFVSQAATRKGGLEANLGWIHQPGLIDLIWQYAILNGPLPPDWLARLSLFGILLFGYPVVLWMADTLRARGEAKSEAATCWWLVLSSGLPVAIAWSASQFLSYSVWHPRYLIIVAAPYFILVGAAVGRLRPPWVRVFTTFLMIGWAVLSGRRELRNTGRVAWQSAVRQMVQAERPSGRDVTIYTFGYLGTTKFYLTAVGGQNFQVISAQERKGQTDWGDHFWILFRASADRYRSPFVDAPRWEKEGLQKLKRRFLAMGYHVGEGIQSGSPGYRLFLLPAWRSAWHPRDSPGAR